MQDYKQIQRKVERRVRGRILYMIHGGISCLFLVLFWIQFIWTATFGYNSYYTSMPRAWFIGEAVKVTLILGFIFGIHTLIRYLNRYADEMRQREMANELARHGLMREQPKGKTKREQGQDFRFTCSVRFIVAQNLVY